MKFTVQWNALEKRQLLIFALVAFGVPYLMGIAMGAGFYAGSDVSVFPNAQMFYPAAGVMLALFVTKKEDNMMPRKFFCVLSGAYCSDAGVQPGQCAGAGAAVGAHQ